MTRLLARTRALTVAGCYLIVSAPDAVFAQDAAVAADASAPAAHHTSDNCVADPLPAGRAPAIETVVNPPNPEPITTTS